MPRSKAEIYLHLVWATRNREPMLTPKIEPDVYRCINAALGELGCDLCAIGGLPDHVHVLVQVPTKCSAAQIVKLAKGASSRLINEAAHFSEALYWQEGYGVFSISLSHLKRVTAYVLDQKQRHEIGADLDRMGTCGAIWCIVGWPSGSLLVRLPGGKSCEGLKPSR